MGIIGGNCHVPGEPEAELTAAGAIFIFPFIGLFMYCASLESPWPMILVFLGLPIFAIVMRKIENRIISWFKNRKEE